MSALVQTETISKSIRCVVLNRPERRNALSIELLKQLEDTLQKLESDSDCRVVILRGAGSIFSSGLELLEATDPEHTGESATRAANSMRTIQLSPLVVIAAVQGGAYAGGAALMASCDIVIAETNAKIVFPAARRGVLPSLILDLVRSRVRDGDLRDLFLTGLPADALSAQRMGLVQRVVGANDLLTEAVRVAAAVAVGAPDTIRQTKALIQNANSGRAGSDSAFAATIQEHLDRQNRDEAREGMAAFLEKRQPWWVRPTIQSPAASAPTMTSSKESHH
jgi:methylglutaconyl-CoA hydratase